MSDRKDEYPNTTVGRLQRERDEDEKITALCAEGAQAYKNALNSVAASPNGKLFLQTLIKAIRVNEPVTAQNNVALIECNAQKNVYLQHIRPYLEPDVKKELEN